MQDKDNRKYKGPKWSLFSEIEDQDCIYLEVCENGSSIMYRGPWGAPVSLGGGRPRGLQNGRP